MKRKNNKKLALLLILVLVISVGYAALASNLKINGSSNVKASSWNVYWDNVQIKDGSVPADNNNKARITDSAKTQVEFNVVLSEPGDFYEFTVDAVNNGTIDAMIAKDGIVNGGYTDSSYTTPATLPDTVSYTVTYADGKPIQEKHLLAKKNGSTPTTETYKVRIEYRNDDSINPGDLDNDNDHTYYFKFSVNYVQADNSAVDSHPSAIRRVSTQNEGQITPGDVIGIGETEEFYVISSDANNTVLLAKYNLLVGNIVGDMDLNGTIPITGTIPTTTEGYGLQSSEATGYIDSGEGTHKGTIDFSATNYWEDDSNNLISPYNENGASFLGNPRPYVYDSNSKIYQYISGENGYIEKLKAMGAPSTIKGRLLSFEEAYSIKKEKDNGTSIICDGKQSYWLGSAFHGSVWSVDSGYGIYNMDYNRADFSGVRPVIEIPTSEIK